MVVVVSPLSLGCSSAAATSGSDSSSPHAAPSSAATAMPAPSFMYLRFISCPPLGGDVVVLGRTTRLGCDRSEEHTSELQSLMRISYAVFCLKKKTTNKP